MTSCALCAKAAGAPEAEQFAALASGEWCPEHATALVAAHAQREAAEAMKATADYRREDAALAAQGQEAEADLRWFEKHESECGGCSDATVPAHERRARCAGRTTELGREAHEAALTGMGRG